MEKVYTAIRISTLRGDLKIPFNAYIKVGSKHILYCRQGDSFEGERLERLKAKNLKKLFILKDQEPKYRQYMNENIEMAFNKSLGRPLPIRAEIIQGVTQAMTEDIFENPDNEAFFRVAQHATKKFAQLVATEKDSLAAILNIKNEEKNLAHHGVNVSTLSMAIAHELGLTKSKKNLMPHLMTGALLHDIGHYSTGLDFARPVDEFTKEELSAYREHPRAGAVMVKELAHFDPLVSKIILQHEEKMDGNGFPQGLKGVEMDPLVLIVSVANTYDRLINFEGLGHKEAIKKLLIEKMGEYPLENLQALQNLLKSRNVIT